MSARAMPSKPGDDAAVSLWGNVLCQQLSLPALNWRREQREKYSFYRETVTPSIFAQPNPAAFQNLMHFLFTVLDAADAGEKFLGLWPLHPGDKKAESQFRTAVFRWLSAIQKGEWSPCSSSSKKTSTPTKWEMEAVAEAKRLGPVILDVRLNPSHFVSPVGEGPTALVAKFAHLVASVASIRKHGSQKVELTPVVAERPRGKKNKREKTRNKIASLKAETDFERLSDVLEIAREESMHLHRAGQLSSQVFSDVQKSNAHIEEQISAVSEANATFSRTDSDSLSEVVKEVCPQISLLRTFNRDLIAKPNLVEMASERETKLELSLEAISRHADGSVSIAEINELKEKLKRGIPVEVDEILSVCEEGWKMFQSHIEKQSIDGSKLLALRKVANESRDVASCVNPVLEEMTECGRSSFALMSEFNRNHKSQSSDNGTLDEAKETASVASSAVPSVEQISARLNRSLCLSFPERRKLLADMVRNRQNDFNNNDDHEGQVEATNDDGDPRIVERLKKLTLYSSAAATPTAFSATIPRGKSLDGTDRSSDSMRADEERENVEEEEEEEEELGLTLVDDDDDDVDDETGEGKENAQTANLTRSHFDSVFSPLVRSHVKSGCGDQVSRRDASDLSSGVRSNHAVDGALSDLDLRANEGTSRDDKVSSASVASFDSSSSASLASGTSFAAAAAQQTAASSLLALNGLPAERRWSSLGAQDEDGLTELSMSKLDGLDASFLC